MTGKDVYLQMTWSWPDKTWNICVHIVCNEIQVKVNLEITTFFFYLRFPYCPNFFWFGVVHWRMIIWLFTYAMWPVNAKKTFPLQFCEIFLFQIAWKTTSCERKSFFAIYRSFCEIDAFPLSIFSIHSFNLRNLKGNGTAATVFFGGALILVWLSLKRFSFTQRKWPK